MPLIRVGFVRVYSSQSESIRVIPGWCDRIRVRPSSFESVRFR